MPFGLCNTPATFKGMGKLYLCDSLIYWGDIIVSFINIRGAPGKLQAVFSGLGLHNLKLKANKCEFFKSQVIYPVHFDSEEGVQADPAKIATVQNLRISIR